MDRNEICKLIIQSIKDYITSPDKLEAHRDPKHFVRKRKLSMLQIIIFLFYSSKSCLNINLSTIRSNLPDLQFPKISKQAFSKARQFISPSLFRELFFLSIDLFYKHIPERKTWHGYHIFAIDGSKFELPNSKSNFSYFGEMFGYPDPNRKFTMALASIVYDVLDDYIVHASFMRYLASERSAAKLHLQALEDLDIYENSIVIFDRGYYSEGMFRYCVDHGHLCLMRIKERLNLAKKCHGDTVLSLFGDPKTNTEDIRVRVIEVELPDGTFEYLVTNIFDDSIAKEMFKELYFMRWPVEVKYKELKSRFKIEEFNGATTIAVFQEFYISLLLANIASLIKNQADQIVEDNARPTNKYRYQANRSFIVARIKDVVPKILCGILAMSVICDIYEEACLCKSQIIPGRSFRRKKNKAKGRTHFNNQKPSI